MTVRDDVPIQISGINVLSLSYHQAFVTSFSDLLSVRVKRVVGKIDAIRPRQRHSDIGVSNFGSNKSSMTSTDNSVSYRIHVDIRGR